MVFIQDPADAEALRRAISAVPFGFILVQATPDEVTALLAVIIQCLGVINDLRARIRQQDAVADLGKEVVAT